MLRGLERYGTRPEVSEQGTYACGRRLYKILPEDAFDRQPLMRGPFQLVADVRLDNRADLAAALGLKVSEQAVLADAELLFECLLKWRANAVDKLIGEFAFALWNGDEETLLLGRDLFGHRPLYYHRGSDFFAFASMPSGLHALPRIPREFDPEAMAEELGLLSVLGNRTHFLGIKRLNAGHLLEVTASGKSVTRYWQPPDPDTRRRTSADYEEELRSVVDTAVREQLRGAGGAVGCHLSGGLDSSTVTATAARQLREGKVVAFTAAPREGFGGHVPPQTIADECEFAAETARLYPNIEHVMVRGSHETLMDVIDRQYEYMQQPTNGTCNSLWAREISRTAKERGISVMLVGFTGNITASYSGREAWSSLLVRGRLLKMLTIGARLRAKGIATRTLAAQLLGPLLPRQIWAQACRVMGRPTDLSGYTAVNPHLRDSLWARAEDEGLDLLYRPSNDPNRFRLHALFDGENGNYFKGKLAEFGLSFRDPLSDKRVVEFCLKVPPEEYIRDGDERGLARRAFSDRLPRSVTNHYSRGYQGADWYETVERDMHLLRDELQVIERCPAAADALDSTWLRQSVDTWPSSGWTRRDVILRYRFGLLRGISAGHFMRKIAGTN